MLKILRADQVKSCDAYTITHEPVASIDLMERACHAFVAWFTSRFANNERIGIVCGTGNNGGDGLGIARLLKEAGYPVRVWVVRGETAESEDFSKNLSRLSGTLELYEIVTAADRGLFGDCTVLIDAIFGSGLSRPAEGIYAQAISCINKTRATRIAVDIPSGVMADRHSLGSIVQATHTISFQLPKLAFLFPENYEYVGEWHLVDIGLSKTFIQQADTPHLYVTPSAVRKKIKIRSKFDHKGSHGHALLVAGSYGKMGACILASRAALRSGVGLLTAHVPGSGNSILQTAVPEAMTSIDPDEKRFTSCETTDTFAAIGIGPGIGQDARTAAGLARLLDASKPMVIDADALNILSTHRELYQRIPPGSILTPHPKEFERLAGPWKDDFERLERQKLLAGEINAVIVLKGAHTSIALPDGRTFFNSTGNPGMATGGTGDVLTGVLTGLLAQGYSSADAAITGVYLHGLAGDLAAAANGIISLTASDVIDHIPGAFKMTAK